MHQNLLVLYKEKLKNAYKMGKIENFLNQKMHIFESFLGQKVCPVDCAQTLRHTDYCGHPFRVSGFFPSTYHQGSAQLFMFLSTSQAQVQATK